MEVSFSALKRKIPKDFLLPVLSGIFIGTSYIPFPPWASLFCFVPLWLFWTRQKSLKNVLLGGWLASFIFTLIGFNWVSHLLHEFAHLPAPLAVFGMLVFASVAHLFVPLAGGLWFWGQTKFQWSARISLGIMVLLTVLSETYSLTLFDWNFGYSWYGSGIPIYHWAEIIGFSGLSSATLLCNLPLFLAWNKRKQISGKILLAAVVGGFGVFNVGGLYLKNRLPEPDTSLNVLLVQGNIGNEEKMAAELGRGFRSEIINRYFSLTDQGLIKHLDSNIDFAIWPEAAFAALLGIDHLRGRYARALKRYLTERRLALITGAYSTERQSGFITNSLFFLDNTGKIVPPHYSKTILLAFGEYIPGESMFPQIREWLPPIGQYARGPGPTVLLKWKGFNIGPQICYESLFPGFSRGLANLGAQFIVNVTNDSWYGTWQEPYQHMVMTLARAVEYRRPVIRATNTGISTVALASGKTLERSPLHQDWTGLYTVPYLKDPKATFYQKWYGVVPTILWTSLTIFLLAGMRKSLGKKSNFERAS